MTDVSSGYLEGEYKMIETQKGGPGPDQKSSVMEKKRMVSGTGKGGSEGEHSPQKSENGSIIPTCRVDNDDDDENEVSRISNVDSYASLRIAGSPRAQVTGVRNEEQDVEADAYGSGEEDIQYSDGSDYEQVDDDVYESDASYEDLDGGFSGYARVAVVDGEQAKTKPMERTFSPYARISVPDMPEAEHRKYIDRDYSPYARVSMPGSESDHGNFTETDTGFARISVAGSDTDFGNRGDRDRYARISVAGSEYGRDVDTREVPGYARISVAGGKTSSKVDRGIHLEREFSGYARVSAPSSEAEPGVYVRVSVAGSEADLGDYARISVAGSGSDEGKEVDRQLSGFARVSVAGSEHGKEMDREYSRYARVSVAGSEAEYGRDLERDSPAYARISVVGSEVEYGKEIDSNFSVYPRKFAGEKNLDIGSPVGSRLKVVTHEAEHVFEEKELSSSGLVVQDEEDNESWDEEYRSYMELSPEVRAKLQYQVRVVLVSPLFELQEHKLSAFSSVYKKKFGKDVEETGFSSAARLCRAMPHVVQRKRLDEDGELILVDSGKNRRAVAGIRSGLRRIVFEVLNSHSAKIMYEQLEEECSQLLGEPLVEVLTEHGYDTPTVECLVKDMLDIVSCEEDGLKSGASLCADAEDPALTDGLLIRRITSCRKIVYTPDPKQMVAEVEDVQATAGEPNGAQHPRTLQPESLKVGGSLTLRGLKNEIRRYGESNLDSKPSVGDEILQARLHLQILLAFYNSGHGVELNNICELYETTFKRSLDLQLLGFESVLELARCWQDIFLFQEFRPDWVFLVPSLGNRRILNTVRTGLRSTVFSILVDTFPEGLDPLDFLHRLQKATSGKLWEVLDTNGYVCSELGKTESFLGSNSEFQLAEFEEICILLDDMMDFVRLGSNEDGSLVVKLASKDPPLIDLVDCKMEETDLGSFDELFVNLMMIAVDETEDVNGEEGSVENGAKQGDADLPAAGRVRTIVENFEYIAGLRSVHSQTPDTLRLKHEIRLILASPEYLEDGIAWSDLNNVYKDRTGQELGSKATVKGLLRYMPDIVCKESLVEKHARLSKTPKNLRTLSATRAGLRQVLFWALLKNPGGIWANLLEGWFTDFAGMSLAATLQPHGYEASKSRPLFPVSIFLRDMNDILQKKSAHYDVFIWAGGVKDPVHSDAALLGLSELMIQYDPLRGEETHNVSERIAQFERSFARKAALKDQKEDHQTDSESEERLTEEDISEKAVMEAHNIEEEEQGVDLDSTKSASGKNVEEPQDNNAHISQSEAGEVVLNDVTGEKAGVIKHGSDEEYQVDTIAVVPVISGDKEEHVTGDVVYFQGGDEREVVLHMDSISTYEDKGKEEGEEYLADIEAGVGSESGSNDEAGEDEKVYVLGNKDIRENDQERVYVLGSQDDNRGEDERVYVLSGEGVKVRQEEEEEKLDSMAEAYAQLRVAGKGPKVNLDEWQFTDSEEEEGYAFDDEDDNDFDGEEEEEEEEEEVENEEEEAASQGSTTEHHDSDQKQPRVTVPYDNAEPRDATRAWVLPSKSIPVK